MKTHPSITPKAAKDSDSLPPLYTEEQVGPLVDELGFLLHEIADSMNGDDDTKLRCIKELERRLPGFVALSTFQRKERG